MLSENGFLMKALAMVNSEFEFQLLRKSEGCRSRLIPAVWMCPALLLWIGFYFVSVLRTQVNALQRDSQWTCFLCQQPMSDPAVWKGLCGDCIPLDTSFQAYLEGAVGGPSFQTQILNSFYGFSKVIWRYNFLTQVPWNSYLFTLLNINPMSKQSPTTKCITKVSSRFNSRSPSQINDGFRFI